MQVRFQGCAVVGKVVRVAWYNENWSSVVQYKDALSRST